MIWTLHAKPDQTGRLPAPHVLAETLVAVPERRSGWALFFPALWLAWHGLWLALAALAIVTLALLALLGTPFMAVTLALFALPGIYLWLEGNQLLRNRLDRRGYALIDVVEAPDEETAIGLHLGGRYPERPAYAPAGPETPRPILPDRPRQQPAESFGIFGA